MTVIRYLLECIGTMTFALCVAALLVACVGEFRYWLAHRHDERDEFGNYLEALRTPGMGDLSDTPIFDSVCEDVAAASARYIDSEWWLEDRNSGGAA